MRNCNLKSKNLIINHNENEDRLQYFNVQNNK